jgi:CelD/BcsL family acetyltransferase involved in cellulose biosynthesis
VPGFNINFHVLTQAEEIQQNWLDLQDRAECSYFQSWGWISSWLNKVVDDRQVMVFQVWSDQLLVGLGLFVPADIKRRLVIHSKALFLNEYPFGSKNMVIEYNGILAAHGFEQRVYEKVVKYFKGELKNYDELNFGGIPEIASSYLDNMTDPVIKFEILEESLSWQVELSATHETLDQYLYSLSKNRRGQIRRSIRLYEEQGPIALHVASSIEEAMEYFKQMELLHTRRWQVKGKPGVFSNPVWKKFHTDLISKRFNEGEIQLLKVTCADKTIGHLYNIIWRKKVYVLQTGFELPPDSRFMPGYVSHVLSIIHNQQLGMVEYDFLHGDDLYKKILSNKRHKLFWVVLQKPKIKFRCEDAALRCFRACRRH